MTGRGKKNRKNDEGEQLEKAKNKIAEKKMEKKKQQNKKRRQRYNKKKSDATTDPKICKPETMTVEETEKIEDHNEEGGQGSQSDIDEKKANQTIALPEESSNADVDDSDSDLPDLTQASCPAPNVIYSPPPVPPQPTPLSIKNSLLVSLLKGAYVPADHWMFGNPLHMMKDIRPYARH